MFTRSLGNIRFHHFDNEQQKSTSLNVNQQNETRFSRIGIEIWFYAIWVDFQFWDFMNMSAAEVCAWLMCELRTHQWKYKFLHRYPALIYSSCDYGSVCGNTEILILTLICSAVNVQITLLMIRTYLIPLKHETQDKSLVKITRNAWGGARGFVKKGILVVFYY